MALSYIAYTGNGSTTDYTFSFPYLSKTDVFVYVDGVSVPFTWINSSAIRCTTAPAASTYIQVRRSTQKASPPVNFTDGSVLLESDLDSLTLWSLYIAQESSDNSSSSMTVGLVGSFDAQSKKIINVASGVSDTDAVNMSQMTTQLAANIVSLNAIAASASGSATVATTKASESSSSATASAASAAAAAASALSINPANLVQQDSSTGAAYLPTGTTAQRPVSPSSGYARFNTTLALTEIWNGSVWAPIGSGATGAVGNSAFYENDQTITGSYTLSANKNAMSAGPIVINSGVVVTVPTGATWSIV